MEARTTQSTRDENTTGRETSPTPKTMIRSEELLGGRRELGILHAGGMYRLSLTRQGKLILTK
ncbi:MAG: hemin uptake protein HemP [Alphaproteobacteria bacterium]